MRCWNLTRCGRSSSSVRTSAGSGLLSAAEPARSLRMPSATEARLPAAYCGSGFRRRTSAAFCIQTSGRPMPRFCPKDSIERQAKARGKHVILSALTASCASAWRGLCGGRFRFPSVMRCTRFACCCFCTSTTDTSKSS